jgi:hypothetical protein
MASSAIEILHEWWTKEMAGLVDEKEISRCGQRLHQLMMNIAICKAPRNRKNSQAISILILLIVAQHSAEASWE